MTSSAIRIVVSSRHVVSAAPPLEVFVVIPRTGEETPPTVSIGVTPPRTSWSISLSLSLLSAAPKSVSSAPLIGTDGSVFPAITAATAAAANTALIVPPSSDAISGPTSTTRSLLTAFARFTICATVSSEPPMTAMRSRLAAEASSAAVLRSRCTLCAALSHTITPTSSSSESAANALA